MGDALAEGQRSIPVDEATGMNKSFPGALTGEPGRGKINLVDIDTSWRD